MKRKPTVGYTYKTVPQEWRECSVWARPSVEHLTVDERARFDRLELAIKTYLESGALKAAAEAGCCSKQTVIDKLNRCLTLNDDGSIVGWRGLLPYERLGGARYRRRNLPTGPRAAEKGAAGSFETFLCEHENLRTILHQAIRRGGDVKGKGKSHNPKSQSVFSAFNKACIAAGLTMNDYPLNSKSEARRTIERYVNNYIPTDPASVETWYGVDARGRMNLGTGKQRFPIAMAPLDLCGADAHEMHCYGVIIVQGPAGPQAVPIERIWIVPIIDFKSRCVLRYSISIRTEINAETVEEALAACDDPWKPRELRVKGQTYEPGAGFPVGCIDGLTHCRTCALQLDNAAAHFANKLIQTARRALGCAVTFGPVGAWWRNAITERFFKTLEMYGFQCLSSSAGSNPADVHRRDPVKNAIRNEITWEELLDLVDVLLANYNATPHSALGGQTPLSVMRAGLAVHSESYLPRWPVPETANSPEFGVAIERRTIRGDQKKGTAPYVLVDEVRYTNAELSDRFDLIGTEALLHIRDRDMTVKAFLPSGVSFGQLNCLGPGWRDHTHSRSMRKTINALIRNGDLLGHDPVVEYVAYLTGKTVDEAIAAPTKLSHSGTQLAEAVRITGIKVADVVPAPEPIQPADRYIPAHIKRPSWQQS